MGNPGFGNKPTAIKPTPAGPTNWKKLDPKVADEVEKWVDAAEHLQDVLVPYIRVRTQQYLDQWLTQMISAKSDANPPPEESKSHWLIALAGNLLWAASCFIPGAGVVQGAVQGMSAMGKVMYATMTVAGAAAGGGVADHIATDSNGAPTGKDVVARMLNNKREEMGKVFDKNIDAWTARLILEPGFRSSDFRSKGRNKYLEALDSLLWSGLFPNFHFENYNEIYDTGLTAINDTLAEFNRQYHQWMVARQTYVDNVERARGSRYKNDSYNDYAGRSRQEIDLDVYAYWEKHHPFKPRLSFPKQMN